MIGGSLERKDAVCRVECRESGSEEWMISGSVEWRKRCSVEWRGMERMSKGSVDALDEMKKKAQERWKDKKEGEHKEKAMSQYLQSEMNKFQDAYVVTVSSWLPITDLSDDEYVTVCLNVQQSQKLAEEFSEIGACVDSGSKLDIHKHAEHVKLTMESNVFLEGITEGAVEVQCSVCRFLTVDSAGNPVLLETKGRGILFKQATSTIVSLSNLLSAGCSVHFEQGQPSDQQYGGTITCPDGTKAEAVHHENYLSTVKSLKAKISDANPYTEALLDMAEEVEPKRESVFPSNLKAVEEVDQKMMQVIHDKWGHPSNSKMERIVQYYKRTRKGFPPCFLKALRKFKCKSCAMAKSARVYKKTKRMKLKMANNKRRKNHSSCKAKTVEQVLLENELTKEEHEDEMFNAFAGNELHMDYAHSISLGYFKERYYLWFVVGGKNFMWATTTTTQMELEDLMQDFLSISNLKICKVRTDNEFTASTKFKTYCRRKGIVLCPAASYTHTMQARAEGVVKICKDLVRTALLANNAPARFWPFALLHVCHVYNYWPGANSPSQWESMTTSNFFFNINRDLHQFTCYMVAKLHSYHPLVVANKTHADRGLEGAFLGWHDSTLTCLMYSFQLQRILQVQDTVFDHDDEYLFLDPACLVSRGMLTDDMVREMLETDLK
eukprot:848464-Rhodomonas_salina.1